MNLPVVFRPQAEAEVRDARRWYESRRAGLGDEFRAALDEVIERVGRQPGLFPQVHGAIRRALIQRFPYGIYFEVVAEQVLVLGVVHGHRDPTVWQARR